MIWSKRKLKVLKVLDFGRWKGIEVSKFEGFLRAVFFYNSVKSYYYRTILVHKYKYYLRCTFHSGIKRLYIKNTALVAQLSPVD